MASHELSPNALGQPSVIDAEQTLQDRPLIIASNRGPMTFTHELARVVQHGKDEARAVGVVGLTLTGWMAGALWPRLLVMLGIYDYGTFYLDSQALLAALDAMRLGADPHAVNPLDPLLRYHVYSDWWLALRWSNWSPSTARMPLGQCRN